VFIQQRKQNRNDAVKPVRGRNKIRLVGQLVERRVEFESVARGPELFQVRRAIVRSSIRICARPIMRALHYSSRRQRRTRLSAIRRHGICRTAENSRMYLGDTSPRGEGFVVTFQQGKLHNFSFHIGGRSYI